MGIWRGDGAGGVHRAGLADENGLHLTVAAMALVGRGVHLHRAGHRRGVGKLMGHPVVWDARLTSELVLLFLYAVIALWHAFDDRKWLARAAGILVLVGVVNLPVIHYLLSGGTPCTRLDAMQQKHRPGDALTLRWAIAGLPAAFL